MNTTIINFKDATREHSHRSIFRSVIRAIRNLFIATLTAGWVSLIFIGGIAAVIAIGAGILYFTVSTIVCLVTC